MNRDAVATAFSALGLLLFVIFQLAASARHTAVVPEVSTNSKTFQIAEHWHKPEPAAAGSARDSDRETFVINNNGTIF